MHNKNTRNRVLRRTREECTEQIGKEKYDFNRDEELIKYKYLCGAKMKRKEWKKCKNYINSYSYSEWKLNVREKYNVYSKNQLEEFSRYLELGIRSRGVRRELDSVVFAAVLSSVFSGVLTNFVLPQLQEAKTVVDYFIIVIICMLVILGATGLMLWMIYTIYVPMYNSNLEQHLYFDYKVIIDEIIKEKISE